MLQRPFFIDARVRVAQPLLTPRSLGALESVVELPVARPKLLAHETEDSMITGGTRSLNRRLLALNLDPNPNRQPARPHPVTLAASSFGLSA